MSLRLNELAILYNNYITIYLHSHFGRWKICHMSNNNCTGCLILMIHTSSESYFCHQRTKLFVILLLRGSTTT